MWFEPTSYVPLLPMVYHLRLSLLHSSSRLIELTNTHVIISFFFKRHPFPFLQRGSLISLLNKLFPIINLLENYFTSASDPISQYRLYYRVARVYDYLKIITCNETTNSRSLSVHLHVERFFPLLWSRCIQ